MIRANALTSFLYQRLGFSFLGLVLKSNDSKVRNIIKI